MLIIFVCFIASIVIYTIWENNRIMLVEQHIEIENLPEELEGFKILQVTDLHEKKFGKGQTRLINKINGTEYDVIAFTGDMLETGNTTDFEPFYTLIDGIENKEHALFVPGNSDPEPYRTDRNSFFEQHAFIQGMEERDVDHLESVYTVRSNSANVHFVEFEQSLHKTERVLRELERQYQNTDNHVYQEYLKHRMHLLKEMRAVDGSNEDDVLISLYHYPVVDLRMDIHIDDPDAVFREFDLMLAGHYHGGQIRLPFVGALFVPEPYYERSGLFPPQDRVKGLWEYRGVKQYVSAGLGSSEALPLFNFRFLNPPEINLLTLKRKDTAASD